jgi:hypothetical protein
MLYGRNELASSLGVSTSPMAKGINQGCYVAVVLSTKISQGSLLHPHHHRMRSALLTIPILALGGLSRASMAPAAVFVPDAIVPAGVHAPTPTPVVRGPTAAASTLPGRGLALPMLRTERTRRVPGARPLGVQLVHVLQRQSRLGLDQRRHGKHCISEHSA